MQGLGRVGPGLLHFLGQLWLKTLLGIPNFKKVTASLPWATIFDGNFEMYL